MARYCDSKQLERYWFEWAMASNVPTLEPLRHVGAVYSRVKLDQIVTQKTQTCKNPWLPLREHLLILDQPTPVTSVDGVVNIDLKSSNIMVANSLLHDTIIQDGYYLESTVELAWGKLVMEIQKLCEGISRKFSTDYDVRMEIEQEALVMVAEKISRKKIRYDPGKAPVFNFLTTTIHRCIYNHLRKTGRANRQMQELTDRMINGNLDLNMRSYRPIGGS